MLKGTGEKSLSGIHRYCILPGSNDGWLYIPLVQ